MSKVPSPREFFTALHHALLASDSVLLLHHHQLQGSSSSSAGAEGGAWGAAAAAAGGGGGQRGSAGWAGRGEKEEVQVLCLRAMAEVFHQHAGERWAGGDEDAKGRR